MSNRPKKPLNECVRDFNDALHQGDAPALEIAETALRKVVQDRLRRMKYRGYKDSEIEALLEALPDEAECIELVYGLMDWKAEGRLKTIH